MLSRARRMLHRASLIASFSFTVVYPGKPAAASGETRSVAIDTHDKESRIGEN